MSGISGFVKELESGAARNVAAKLKAQEVVMKVAVINGNAQNVGIHSWLSWAEAATQKGD